MPPIFINTDNSDKTNKIYIATTVGEAVQEAEDRIRAMVVKAFEKASDFTTNKIANPKGYTLLLRVTKFSAEAGETSCTIAGDIVRYPATFSKDKNADGSGLSKVMTTGEWKGSAKASGTGKRAVLDCVEAIVESMVPRSFPVMKADMARR